MTADQSDSVMRYRVLGTLEFWDGASWRPVARAKCRHVLAILLINANQPVSVDRLRHELWGNDGPASAPKLVQLYIGQLRRILDDASGNLVRTRYPGYQLDVSDGEVDVHRFEDAVTAARRACDAGISGRCAELLGGALANWRGRPYADVVASPMVRLEAARLSERRMAAMEFWLDTEVARGRHDAALPELAVLVNEYPTRERLHELLMLSLYRAGRQAEALAVYEELRRHHATELGIEPNPAVLRLAHAIRPPTPPSTWRAGTPGRRPDRAPGRFVRRRTPGSGWRGISLFAAVVCGS